jgi:hypothetical protein
LLYTDQTAWPVNKYNNNSIQVYINIYLYSALPVDLCSV